MTEKREVKTLDEALDYIEELETSLREAIEIVMKRDDQLRSTERKVLDLETKLDNLKSSD
jgi:hypothetical protein